MVRIIRFHKEILLFLMQVSENILNFLYLKGVYNDNMDNEECELIVRVHDEIINKKHNE